MGVSIGPAIDVLRKNKKSEEQEENNVLRKYIASLLLFLLFETVAITLWKAKGNLFYLLNFSYIGGCLALGTALFTAGKRYARHFLGVFEAATIH